MTEDTIRVVLRSSWRGHRYGATVDMPDDDHTWAWIGQGLCVLHESELDMVPLDGGEWSDPATWPNGVVPTDDDDVVMTGEGINNGVLRETNGNESGTPDPVG